MKHQKKIKMQINISIASKMMQRRKKGLDSIFCKRLNLSSGLSSLSHQRSHTKDDDCKILWKNLARLPYPRGITNDREFF
jgi:hypothetical protein